MTPQEYYNVLIQFLKDTEEMKESNQEKAQELITELLDILREEL